MAGQAATPWAQPWTDWLRAPSSPIQGVGLGELMPRTERITSGRLGPRTESPALGRLVPHTEHAALDGLRLTSTSFHDFRTHEPRIKIDGFAPPDKVVARVSASVATAKSGTDGGSISPAADTVFDSVLSHTHRGWHGLRKTPGCSEAHRKTDSSMNGFYTGAGLRHDHQFDFVRLCYA